MRPTRVDLVLAAVIGLPAVIAAITEPTSLPRAVTVGLAAAMALALALRRRAPLVAASTVTACVLCLGVLDEDGPGMPTIPIALALAAYTLGHDVAMPRAALAGALALVAFWSGQLAQDAPSSDLVATVLIGAVPWTFGRALRRRVEDAERREEEAARAERQRIARELHDVVSHSISVVSVQTQAVRRRLRPDQTEEAAQLRAVEATVRDAMAEMRRLFGMLRAEGAGAPLAPQPGLALLEDLLAETRAAGHRVQLHREGAPRELPAGLDLVAYRVVQEGLTNVRRHAPGAAAEVLLRYADRELEVGVRDDGPGSPGANGHHGHGLAGMRERVELYGGRLTLGSGPGFEVRARLPLEPAP